MLVSLRHGPTELSISASPEPPERDCGQAKGLATVTRRQAENNNARSGKAATNCQGMTGDCMQGRSPKEGKGELQSLYTVLYSSGGSGLGSRRENSRMAFIHSLVLCTT